MWFRRSSYNHSRKVGRVWIHLSTSFFFLECKDFSKGWHLCQLEVLECKKVAWPNSVTEEKYCVEDCGWPLKEFAYECKINLLTGRTHQVGDDIRMMI
ncbi:RNA pseudouridine synthase 6, chloroplastic-like [Camellia sinensis]|uniref:RNA pseudouridine synthase 6, chloroplastic-like n=1 Tax=Camellia sinensis TaxID=4442 RepID=UPI00103589C7|nr:RNA pseudouridine synthase 6, chloroplastic-like [Camellia sinensis]